MYLWTRGTYPPELRDEFQGLVKVVVEVYVVNWFKIKKD